MRLRSPCARAPEAISRAEWLPMEQSVRRKGSYASSARATYSSLIGASFGAKLPTHAPPDERRVDPDNDDASERYAQRACQGNRRRRRRKDRDTAATRRKCGKQVREERAGRRGQERREEGQRHREGALRTLRSRAPPHARKRRKRKQRQHQEPTLEAAVHRIRCGRNREVQHQDRPPQGP